ncbi:hypothetical protein Tco_1498897 [Tanacetum coccineum]
MRGIKAVDLVFCSEQRMTTSYFELGFVGAIYEGKTHQDLHTCLFACFLISKKNQESIKSSYDFLLGYKQCKRTSTFQLQNVGSCNLLRFIGPIGTKWSTETRTMKWDIVVRNKARHVSQGHTQKSLPNDVKSGFSIWFKNEEECISVNLQFNYTDVTSPPLPQIWKALIKDTDADDVDEQHI